MTGPLRLMLVCGDTPGIQLLRKLQQQPCEVVQVMCKPEQTSRGPSVWSVARELGHPTFPASDMRESGFAETLASEQVDLILSVRSPYIIPGPVLEAARIGGFNMHHGPLPEYAGLNVASWALYNGELEHGVTVHWMESGVDTGPIVYLKRFPVVDGDNALSVLGKCVRHGLPMVLDLLAVAEEHPGAIPATPQDLSQRRYYKRTVPQDGRIEWNRPAREVFNFIRACDYFPARSPWGTPATTLCGRAVGIRAASPTAESTDCAPGTVDTRNGTHLRVACLDEWLDIKEVLVDGERTFVEDFLAG